MEAKEEMVKKVVIAFVLWGTSYTLQEIAVIVSIIAGVIGILYTLSSLIIIWLKFFKENKVKDPYSGDIDG